MSKFIPCDVCGNPTSSKRVPARGFARHRSCSPTHGASGYRRGCRCDECRSGQAARLSAFYALRLERDGISYNQRLRRLKDARPVSGTPDCSVCGEPLERWSRVAEPVHKRCRDGYIPGYLAKRAAVVDRDGSVCWLCREPVDFDAPPNSDWSATLDHVVTRAAGGSDGVDNLRLAHRWCNSVRADDRVDLSFFR